MRIELTARKSGKIKGRHRRFFFSVAFALTLLAHLASSPAQTNDASDLAPAAVTPSKRAQKQYLAAKKRFQNESTNVQAAWEFGRAAFDWAEFSTDDTQREELANEGIKACRQAVARQPKLVEGHYYLGMNLGQLARTKSLGALRLVGEMEQEFQIARNLDEKFDYAGPDRNLGSLYLEAPGWPASVGDRSKARQHLERAIKLSPNYPENHLNLIDAYLKWGDKNGAQRELNALKKLWPAAKKQFSGEQWESSWTDWEKRWKKLQSKFAEPAKTLIVPRSGN